MNGSAKLLVMGVIGELAAIAAMFMSLPLWERVCIYFLTHGAASFTFALFMTMLLPSRYSGRQRAIFALFFCFSFCIPLFGAFGMLVSLIYFRFFLKTGERAEFSAVPVPDFVAESGYTPPVMGEGGAWSRLSNELVSRELRLKALLSVGSLEGGNSSRLLQLASADPDDEIRLLAVAIFDQREKLISADITEALVSLKACLDRSEQGALCRRLAFSYWEIVYNELARDELREFFVQQALSYADRALGLIGEDSALTALKGRIHLLRGDVEKAEAAASAALEQGAHPDRILPYLAELAFVRRDFKALRSIFDLDSTLRHKPGIGHVVRFWQDAT